MVGRFANTLGGQREPLFETMQELALQRHNGISRAKGEAGSAPGLSRGLLHNWPGDRRGFKDDTKKTCVSLTRASHRRPSPSWELGGEAISAFPASRGPCAGCRSGWPAPSRRGWLIHLNTRGMCGCAGTGVQQVGGFEELAVPVGCWHSTAGLDVAILVKKLFTDSSWYRILLSTVQCVQCHTVVHVTTALLSVHSAEWDY